MSSQNIYPLSLNGDTFSALKSDYDSMLRHTISKMEDLRVEDATITIKVGVTLEKDQARDFQANGYDAMRDIVKPTFKHEISTVMQIKNKKSGTLGGSMEMVWDKELCQYVMRDIDNGQTTLFDQDGKQVVDAEYTVVEDGGALPAGPAALPAPEGNAGKDDPAHPASQFEYMRQFIGAKLTVMEGMGTYTVRTEDNKVVLSSAFSVMDRFYCSPEKLKPHVGHNVVCVGYGEDSIVDISIECEDCNEILFDIELEEATVSEVGNGDDAEDGEDGGYEYEPPEDGEDDGDGGSEDAED